jgi:hypothetical protein
MLVRRSRTQRRGSFSRLIGKISLALLMALSVADCTYTPPPPAPPFTVLVCFKMATNIYSYIVTPEGSFFLNGSQLIIPVTGAATYDQFTAGYEYKITAYGMSAPVLRTQVAVAGSAVRVGRVPTKTFKYDCRKAAYS